MIGTSVLLGLIAFVLASYLLRLVGMPFYILVALGFGAFGTTTYRQVPKYRSISLAVLAGSQMITVLLIGGYAYSLYQLP